MKTLRLTLVLAASIFLMQGLMAHTTSFVMEEEAYINDIPLDTHDIAADEMFKLAIAKEFQMEEESYVDDIPFDTQTIASQSIYKIAMSEEFELPEEEFIDDIPFNTRKVVHNVKCIR
jgi:hypothetical protein